MSQRVIFFIGGINVFLNDDGSIEWTAGMAIDADGSPHSYHPDNRGLDHIDNAKDGHGGWCGVITNSVGDPVIQSHTDPAPGYFVSPTAYRWPHKDRTDPTAYVDSEHVPFIVVPPQIRLGVVGVVLGCSAVVTNTVSGRECRAVVADIGPRRKLGEASIACAEQVGVVSSPRYGGTSNHIIHYKIFPDVPAIVNGVTYELLRA